MNAKHVTQDVLARYVYRSLDDASREEIDRHFLNCPDCRLRLSEAEKAHAMIRNGIRSALNGQQPSEKMTFESIAPRLGRPNPILRFYQKVSASSTLALVTLGFALALLGGWDVLVDRALDMVNPRVGAYPALAGFLFMIASVQEFDRSHADRTRFSMTMIVAVLLWLGSVILGLLNIIVVRDLAIFAVITAGGDALAAEPITIMAVMAAAVVFIGVVVGGAEYHYKHFGQPGSWKVFSFTLLGQLFLLVLPYLLF